MPDNNISEELVRSFKEFCAVNDNIAQQYLIHCDGNLEDAVQLFFSTGGSLQNTYEGHHNEENRRREYQRMPARQATPSSSWWETFITLIALPFRFTITTLYDFLGLFLNIFVAHRPALTDPKGDVERFITAYNESLQNDAVNRIDFFNGSFDDALRFAKNNIRMLLVYVHHPHNKNSSGFIETVLHSEQMQTLIREQNLVVFGVSVTTPQGRVVSDLIRSAGEPLLGLITFRQNTPLVALRLTGVYDPDTAVVNLRLACDDYQAQLNLLRMQRAQLDENQRIREEQEREYRESAAKDRARIQERRRLESERAEAEEIERKKQEEIEARKQLLETRRAEIRASIVEEPIGDNVVRIQIRFPSGARLDRKFKPTDSLEDLFSAAFAHEQCPIYFSVFTNFPRKEIHCAPTWYHDVCTAQFLAEGLEVTDFHPVRSLRDEGIDHSCVVMIQDCLA